MTLKKAIEKRGGIFMKQGEMGSIYTKLAVFEFIEEKVIWRIGLILKANLLSVVHSWGLGRPDQIENLKK